MNEQNPQSNERLWQKWIWKNREADKVAARKRLRFFQIVLVIAVVAVIAHNFLR